MKTKKSAAFEAWEKTMLAQIKTCESSIRCLSEEIAATKTLSTALKEMLRIGRIEERGR